LHLRNASEATAKTGHPNCRRPAIVIVVLQWKVPRDTALFRLRHAEALGLTYEEYTLEILERGRYLQPHDRERIEAIKLARARKG
jgi:hypothetical protein